MKVLIHACPGRMWYVDGFLVPSLKEQGADEVEVWCDTELKGNLAACQERFASRQGHGITWHIQDDVLICRDFVKRCRELDALDGDVAYGFCNESFTDDPAQSGHVSVFDAWHSFQCVRIPDDYARECAEWFKTDGRNNQYYSLWVASSMMDDSVFREFLLDRHSYEMVHNVKPNLVEHVDYIIGGSALHPWRGYIANAYFWEDKELVAELKEAVKGKVQYLH